MEGKPASYIQALRIILISAWVSLGLGILISAASGDPPGLVIAAAATSGVFVAIVTFLPISRLTSPGPHLDVIILLGSVLTIGSVTLTGALSSPYVLLALMPPLLGAMATGYRLGLSAALLSAGLLAAVVSVESGLLTALDGLGTLALFPLLAAVVAQIRRLLLETEERATTLEAASLEAEAQLARLRHANDLLRRLTDVYARGSTNPVEVGRSATEAIVEYRPGAFATVTMFDARGPVVVARTGTDSPDFIRTRFPLGDGEVTSGVVTIGTSEPLAAEERTEIERLLRPVAVSFANAVLLQEIASEAVEEERLRLARELHDEVGPALAALGFALDGVAMQTPAAPFVSDLRDIRTALGDVVEDLRAIIADLRSERAGSINSELSAAIGGLTVPPEIEIDIHERRPPRSTVGRQILAILTEAVRNAHRHADAERIAVSGTVDRETVHVEVTDDGKGFDPSRLPDGHYGVMGMRERADRIGATVEIDSTDSGTTVRVVWKERR